MKPMFSFSGIFHDAQLRSEMGRAAYGRAFRHGAGRTGLTGLMAAGAMLLVATPASAQEAADVRLALLGDLSILKTKDLDFGIIIGKTAGTIVMPATAAPTCTATGGLVHAQKCQPAEFLGKGESGRIVRIKKPVSDRIELIGPGSNMNISALTLNGAPELTLVKATPGYSRFRISSANGIFTFRLAGTLNVGANQAPGKYTGTFNVDINYD
ncbi:DUF4402 domain-containing protein [Altererythrobacter confluentis]|uniref:DUF4402 domain-containing protein n=1 Tax=Allopontixanthobacter confluentis TaxID=1849021 RepID=A0A6L7GHE9_9SPHN|nr:DUF4402 domain-containing protein [Allopontixanthobacter confluentis]MXP15482.1 DUF4402 domain-containing protein [Allopontixanthobacter confluentis]